MSAEEEAKWAPPRVLVGIATFKRPILLRRLLDSLSKLDYPKEKLSVLVVDNDPEGTASEIVKARADVTYVLEVRPGIAAARNAVLHAAGNHRFIAFVDDDETVDSRWLLELVLVQRAFDCAAVAGPALPVYPDGFDEVRLDGFFEPKPRKKGDVLDTCSTCNVLIDVRQLRAHLDSPYFDDSYGLSGGSDTELFRRWRLSNADFRWSDRAIVYDHIPASRLTWAWIRARLQRYGSVDARISLAHHSRVRVLFGSIVRILFGAPGYIKSRLGKTKTSHEATFLRGVGMLRALSGRVPIEYARR